jgi:hypothetical protein
MKPLDDYIRENAGWFDTEEPLIGHYDRFDVKLSSVYEHQSKFGSVFMLKIAAAIVLGLMISYSALVGYRIISRNAEIKAMAAYPELNEAEQYYTKQLEQNYNRIQHLQFNKDKNEKKQIINDLNEMDKQVKMMKKDLIQNPEDERIVNAIITAYVTKMELMDMIISRTEQSSDAVL